MQIQLLLLYLSIRAALYRTTVFFRRSTNIACKHRESGPVAQCCSKLSKKGC